MRKGESRDLRHRRRSLGNAFRNWCHVAVQRFCLSTASMFLCVRYVYDAGRRDEVLEVSFVRAHHGWLAVPEERAMDS